MTGRLRHLAFMLAILLPGPAVAAAAVVDAPAGAVRGVSDDGVNVFRGIPYAEAPVGDRRWKPPVPFPDWDGVRDAAEFGPACFQPESRTGSIYATRLEALSEDCLSLNVWAPEDAKRLPVFVWIHGGALTTGAGSLDMYDGARMAAEGVVVVTINYRLGVFGYLAHPELSAESADRVSGNYGLQDQIAALKWIERNIAAFGGDTENVTIAGESAGALSVMYLMASPKAQGLFDKAIAQSAYMISTPALREDRHGHPSQESVGTKLTKTLGAADIAGLRAMKAEELVKRSPQTGFLPWGTVDGVYLERQLVETFDRGDQARVPVLAGYNEGEIRSLRFLLPPKPSSDADYVARIRAGYGELADLFLSIYPAGNLDESMLATTRDAMYGWTAERLAARQTALDIPSYLYLFDHGYPAADEMGLHAFHAAEIPYVFGTIYETSALWPKIPRTDAERRLSAAMMEYWVSFARDGHPVATGEAVWPAYGEDRTGMVFAKIPQAVPRMTGARYRLHEHVVCRRFAAGGMQWGWNVGVASPPLPAQVPQCR